MNSKAVIFDMDGVLIDSWELHYQSWKESSKEHGFKVDRVKFGNHFGQRCHSFANTLCLEHGVEFDDEKITDWLDIKDKYYRDNFVDNFVENTDLTNLLKDLHNRGFRTGIGSSAPKENIQTLINIMPLGALLKKFVGASDVKEGKPNPEVFLLAADKLGVKPTKCAVIEDSLHGLQAAKSAGMLAIGITGTFNKDELAVYADFVIDNLSEIDVDRVDELIDNK